MKLQCRKCFEILSVETRFKIFNFLKDRSEGASISELVELTKLRQPTITFHVNAMEENGLLLKKRIGKEVICVLKQSCDECPLFSK